MKKVLLLLTKGFETYEASVFIDVMGWNLIDGDHSTKLYSCGATKEVISSFDQKVVVDCLIKDIQVNEFDALAIPGGFEEYGFWEEVYGDETQDLIREFNRQGKLIASICVASIALGKSGILKNKNATTYNLKPIRQETLKSFGVNVQNKPVVQDGNILTCWNPSTAMDVAFLLLELLTSRQNANNIRKMMGFEEK
jgi:protein deglycase